MKKEKVVEKYNLPDENDEQILKTHEQTNYIQDVYTENKEWVLGKKRIIDLNVD